MLYIIFLKKNLSAASQAQKHIILEKTTAAPI
jgi:hypothetical protein